MTGQAAASRLRAHAQDADAQIRSSNRPLPAGLSAGSVRKIYFTAKPGTAQINTKGCEVSRLTTLLILIAALECLPAASRAFCSEQGLTNQATEPQDGKPKKSSEPLLQPYEPITAGYTKDSDDVPYLDVTLSLKYRLLPVECTGNKNRAFFAISTRFGFYWGTRDGSPVIGKDYNPKLIWRHALRDAPAAASGSDTKTGRDARLPLEDVPFIDFAYAHESNGQLIRTQAEYAAAQAALQQPQYVNDNVHRGWDYLQVDWQNVYARDTAHPLFSHLDLKYFLPVGLLQGPEDEYHSWEANPQGKPRKSVDGVAALIRYQSYGIGAPVDDTLAFSRPDLLLKYDTGYYAPFKYSTVRAEFGFQSYVLPIAIWVQSGYMSDLAMYYLKVNSIGIELRVRRF